MTHKERNKMLDDKIESNINQYKIDRLNAEISAFSSGDLNKYEFLTRKDLKYKPNALDKARFEFSPLGKTFSTGLDKTAQCYQEEGVIKLLKDIRDGLAGGVNRKPDDNRHDDNRHDDNRHDDGFDDDKFDTTPYDMPYTSDDENDIKNNKKKYDNLLLKHFQLRKNMKETKDELDKTKDDTSEETIDDTSEETIDELDKTKDDISEDTKDELDKTKDDTSEKSYHSHGFDKDGFYKDTDRRYDPNGFNQDGFYKDTNNKYNPNGFDINGKNKDTNDLFNSNAFNVNGIHKETDNYLILMVLM